MDWLPERIALYDPIVSFFSNEGVDDVRKEGDKDASVPPVRTPWARVSFRGGLSVRPEIGLSERVSGTVLVEIFEPLGVGTGTSLTLAQGLREMFRDLYTTTAGIRIFPSEIAAEGEAGDFYRVLVATRYEVDTIV